MRKLKYFFCGRFFPFALTALAILTVWIVLAVRLPALLAPIAVLERIAAVIAAVAAACGRSPSEYKLSKIALILLLPWTGTLFCLLFPDRAEPYRQDGGNAGSPRLPLSSLAENLSSVKTCSLKTAEYFSVGSEMYPRLLSDLRGAKKSIWLEFYIIAEGIFWSDVLEILTEKACAGVDVRLLYDGFGSALTLPPSFPKEMARRGVKAYCFRPLGFPSRNAGRRDHRKIAAIDGEIAYTGGINLADEYIGEKIRFGHWKDTAIRVTGGAAASLALLFTRTWNAGNPDDVLCPPKPSGGNVPCAVISDDSADRELRAGHQALLRLFAGAEKRLYINTPYLAPDLPLLRALECAALSGVDVRLMIPHIPDKKYPFLLTRSYAAELERSGVQVREYTDGFLHAKSVVSDGTAFVSSYNLDFRSLFLQAECGVAVRQTALADKLAADFLAAWEGGTPLPARGRAYTLFCRLLRLTAPLL